MAGIENGQLTQQATNVVRALQTWMDDSGDGGKAEVVFSLSHFWSYMLEETAGFGAFVVYNGEDIVGDEATAECVGVVRRHFLVGLRRHRGFTNKPGSKLMGLVGTPGPVNNARPFYDVLEECRDVIRSLVMDSDLMLSVPAEYHGAEPSEHLSKWLDSYVFNFSILTRLPTLAPGFGNMT